MRATPHTARVGADGTGAIVHEFPEAKSLRSTPYDRSGSRPRACALAVGVTTKDYNSRPVIVARRFLIGGRVQAVGFRWFAVEQAQLEGVHGFVRNLPDGRVEAIVEGDAQSVDRVERALRRGPRGSRVETFDAEPWAPAGFREFEIRQ
jgi:acylphosphatase